MNAFCFRSACLLFAVSGFFASPERGRGDEVSKEETPAAADSPVEQRPLVVHEWGTFTSLQDERGRSLLGVNTDDEPVPRFVHRLADFLVPPATELAPVYYKGLPRQHRHARMRLETPVVYFYPPEGAELPLSLDVEIGFRGGWITEYYPNADVIHPTVKREGFTFGPIRRDAIGRLAWRGLRIGVDAEPPQTDSRVWLAPRKVRAASVANSAGEAERYLFYRGVGNLQAPLRVERSLQRDRLIIREAEDASVALGSELPLRAMWLVEIRPEGTVAFRYLGRTSVTAGRDRALKTTAASFDDAEFAKENLDKLRRQMRLALIEDGLFEDEADAMLATWEAAYFQSQGMRLFFLLPQEWTDYMLPMKLSTPAKVSRTMVGRIEIVTPRHRKLLREISAAPRSRTDWLPREIGAKNYGLLAEGRLRMKEIENVKIPADYRAYIDLGRFRNAVILDSVEAKDTPDLRSFARQYGLEYFEPQLPGGNAKTAQQ